MTSKPPKGKPREDPRVQRLRIEARLHGGVLPVPFLGTTWQHRGAPYWRRRVGAVLLFTVLLIVVGGMAVGFGLGIAGDGHSPTRVVLALLYALTAIPGVLLGRRALANAPLDSSRAATTTVAPIGALAFALAPLGTGLVLTMLLSMFGRDFIGERTARSMSTSTGGQPNR
jgi:hypothetical protein